MVYLTLMKNCCSNIWVWLIMCKGIKCRRSWVSLELSRIWLIGRSLRWKIIMCWPFIKNSKACTCTERIKFSPKEIIPTNNESITKLNLSFNQTATEAGEELQETKFCTEVRFYIMRAHCKDRDKPTIKGISKTLKILSLTLGLNSATGLNT